MDALYQLVKVLNTPLSAFNGSLEPVRFRPLGYDVFLRHQVQEHRLIASNEVCQAVDGFQYDLFQHYIADIVYLTVSSAAFVVGAAVMLLIGVQALGGAEMEL